MPTAMAQTSLTALLVRLPDQLASDYELEELIGTGAFALVYRLRRRRDGHRLAVKVVEKAPLAARALLPQLYREIMHLREHAETPHVVQLREVVETRDYFFLCFELCARSLEEHVDDEGPLEEDEAFEWFRQALIGVRELHAGGIVHRDLKPSNMLVDADGVLRICDFGWACLESEELDGMSGTRQYAPPEMLQACGLPHTTKVDVYCLGACLQHLLLGRMPEGPEDLPLNASPAVMDLLAELMQHDPEARPTVEEVLARPALQPGPLAQLWQQGREFFAQLGGGAKAPAASGSGGSGGSTGSRRRRAALSACGLSTVTDVVPVVAKEESPAPAAFLGVPATWPVPVPVASPGMSGHGTCWAPRSVATPSRRFHNGFCVGLGSIPTFVNVCPPGHALMMR